MFANYINDPWVRALLYFAAGVGIPVLLAALSQVCKDTPEK